MIDVAIFQDHRAATIEQRTMTLEDIEVMARDTVGASKSVLPWLKLARFGDFRTPKGSLRNNTNVQHISGIEADYDLNIRPMEDAAAALQAAGVRALLYTSPSHMEDLPRWRVLCPTSGPLPGAARADLVARLNTILGGVLSIESFTLSQAYYFGRTVSGTAHATILTTGEPVDVALATTAATYAPRAVADAIALPSMAPGTTPDERTAQALAVAMAAFEAPGATEAGRHQTLLAATNLLAPFILSGHLDVHEAEDHLAAAMGGSGRDPNPGEVAGALSGALRMGFAYVPDSGGAEFPVLEAEPPKPEPIRLLEFTEDHAARLFAIAMAPRYRFDHSGGNWFAFIATMGWGYDRKDGIVDAARVFLEAQRQQWGMDDKDGLRAAGSSFIRNVAGLCKSDPLLATTSDEWDLDPMALGVPGGYVDLRTGALHQADPARLMRRRTTVAPAAGPTPVWSKFLREATGGDADLEAWLQRFAGYVLTGDVSEEMLAFVYGKGKNGKGVFLGVLASILGNYAYQAPAKLFDVNDRENKSYQLAMLEGVRLLMVSETEAGSMLAEAFVKELTGNEGEINARQIYGKPFTFRSQCKVLIVGNHAPKLTGRTEAMERRLRVVPFNNTPPVQDHTLKARLVPEYPAILAWMIAGCGQWITSRLGVCASIQGASASYFEEQDTVAQWVAERCDMTNPNARTSTSALLEDWNGWLRTRGEKAATARDFKSAIQQRLPGCQFMRVASGSVVQGLALQVASMAGLLE